MPRIARNITAFSQPGNWPSLKASLLSHTFKTRRRGSHSSYSSASVLLTFKTRHRGSYSSASVLHTFKTHHRGSYSSASVSTSSRYAIEARTALPTSTHRVPEPQTALPGRQTPSSHVYRGSYSSASTSRPRLASNHVPEPYTALPGITAPARL